MIPGEILRSPYFFRRMPFWVILRETNFNDSSEISSPKDGMERKVGIGKNLLNELLSMPILYYILAVSAILFIQKSLQYQRGGRSIHGSSLIFVSAGPVGNKKFFFAMCRKLEFFILILNKKF